MEAFFWILGLGALVFFGRYPQTGLQPDAALYAGLSRKVLETGEAWKLSGSDGYFPLFYEHPPYFFAWGARVLEALGFSDGAARAIGGIPGLLGFLMIVLWAWVRLGRRPALWTAFALASFGHYTKYAATCMLEAPLSLGVAAAAIGTYEVLWNKRFFGRLLGWTLLAAGCLVATAAKGVAGFGILGGVGLFGLWSLMGERRRWLQIPRAFLLVVFALLFLLVPLAYWALHMVEIERPEWIAGYFTEQVLRSAVSTRGDPSHATGGDRLFYLKTIVRDGWPWWWTVPCAWFLLWRTRVSRRAALVDFTDADFWRSPSLRRWAVLSFCFFFAFAMPFSLVKFQLSHYLHPTYLPLAPVVGAFLDYASRRLWHSLHASNFVRESLALSRLTRSSPRADAVRWSLLVAAGALVGFGTPRVSKTDNRGQPFLIVADEVKAMPERCEVLVSEDSMDRYRMEAYALWYWQGRRWHVVERNEWSWRSERRPQSGKAHWMPEQDLLSKGPGCRSRQGDQDT